nr:aldo/keto reductase [Burkholderia ambifaria]WDS14023.1 aldo/keto reductase [Burkholderia ambifaria]WDS27162.1 aldo/keto reductase [Burkholderia ambifaria]
MVAARTRVAGRLARRGHDAGLDRPANGVLVRRPRHGRRDRRSGQAGGAGSRRAARVALAWALRRPGVAAPIIGLSKPHHMADALAALDVRETALLEAAFDRTIEPVRW